MLLFKEKILAKYIIDTINKKQLENEELLINETEEKYFKQLSNVVKDIQNKFDNYKYILIAGPSSSGKTTTTKYLCEMFAEIGILANYVSLDDFFLDRTKTPVLPNGKKDYENIQALDINEMKKCFSELNKTGQAMFPEYNFFTGVNTKNKKLVKAKDNSIVIIEGNHAFNPVVKNCLGTDKIARIFIHPESSFINKNRENVIDPAQLRLIRRTIRDVGNRGYSPAHTFSIWNEVLIGEDKYITPYKHLADYVIDTVYAYEVMVYKPILKKMFKDEKLVECESILSVVENFNEIPLKKVPEKSLMWEFLKNLKV